jgi:hypothetical protein
MNLLILGEFGALGGSKFSHDVLLALAKNPHWWL